MIAIQGCGKWPLRKLKMCKAPGMVVDSTSNTLSNSKLQAGMDFRMRVLAVTLPLSGLSKLPSLAPALGLKYRYYSRVSGVLRSKLFGLKYITLRCTVSSAWHTSTRNRLSHQHSQNSLLNYVYRFFVHVRRFKSWTLSFIQIVKVPT